VREYTSNESVDRNNLLNRFATPVYGTFEVNHGHHASTKSSSRFLYDLLIVLETRRTRKSNGVQGWALRSDIVQDTYIFVGGSVPVTFEAAISDAKRTEPIKVLRSKINL